MNRRGVGLESVGVGGGECFGDGEKAVGALDGEEGVFEALKFAGEREAKIGLVRQKGGGSGIIVGVEKVEGMEFKIQEGRLSEGEAEHGLEERGGVDQEGGSDQGELESGDNGDGKLPDIGWNGCFVGSVWIIARLVGMVWGKENLGGAEESAAWAAT